MIQRENERAWKLINNSGVSAYDDGNIEFGDLPERIEALYVRIDELEGALRSHVGRAMDEEE